MGPFTQLSQFGLGCFGLFVVFVVFLVFAAGMVWLGWTGILIAAKLYQRRRNRRAVR